MINNKTKEDDMRIGYYQADIVNGIFYAGDSLEDLDIDVLSPSEFLESLDDPQWNAESIAAYFGPEDQEVFNEVKKYGINWSASFV